MPRANQRRRAAVVRQLRALASEIERGEIESFVADHTAILAVVEPVGADGSAQLELTGDFR